MRCRYARLPTSGRDRELENRQTTEICGLGQYLNAFSARCLHQPRCRSMPNFQVVPSFLILDSTDSVMTSWARPARPGGPPKRARDLRRTPLAIDRQRSSGSNGYWAQDRELSQARRQGMSLIVGSDRKLCRALGAFISAGSQAPTWAVPHLAAAYAGGTWVANPGGPACGAPFPGPRGSAG